VTVRAATAALLIGLVTASAASAEDKRDLLVMYFSGGSEHFDVRSSATGALVRTLDTSTSNMAFPSWSPDEATVAYFESGTIKLRPAAGGPPTPVGPGGSPAFSPVSNEIAYLSWTSPNRTVRVISTNGQVDREIAGSSNQYNSEAPAWSPDGNRIAFGRGGSILSAPASGGGQVSTIASPAPGQALSRPAFSPDGTRIAYVSTSTAPPAPIFPPDQLIVRNLATGAEQPIVSHPTGYVHFGNLNSPSWSADSDRIAFIEVDATQSTSNPTYTLSTIRSDGSDRRPLMTQNTFIDFASWANAPRAPSYYVKHVEIAQAISPALGPLPAADPLNPGVTPFPWTVPSVAGSSIPLVAQKQTLLRIYVGDASLPAGATANRLISYRVSGATLGGTPVEGEADVEVTAPDAVPAQSKVTGALNAWLPATASASGSPVNFQVEVNTGEEALECAVCYPDGNSAEVQGASFEEGGTVVLQPVEMLVIKKGGDIRHPFGYDAKFWPALEPMLPVRAGGLKVRGPVTPILLGIDELKPGILTWNRDGYACNVLVARLEEYRLTAQGPVSGFGAVRWVGVSTLGGLPGVTVGCNGQASGIPGKSYVMTISKKPTAVHELGHTLGLAHTLGYEAEDDAPEGAVKLPYDGIGGFGYDSSLVNQVNSPLEYGDIMSYSPNRWISPNSWHGFFEAILAESNPALGPTRRVASAAASQRVRKRRLVAGVIHNRKAVFLNTFVADARAPDARGPVAGRVVGLNRAGHRIASVAIHQAKHADVDELPPFVVSLPASAKVAALAVLPAKGRRPLTTMRRSKHAPTARFLKLPRRAPARKSLKVGWAARDRDGGKLTVVIQGRRGGGRWRTVTIGPGRASVSLKPGSLGKGKRLSLRLLVSDGLNTAVVTARSISLKR
jgi:hypothetical protein